MGQGGTDGRHQGRLTRRCHRELRPKSIGDILRNNVKEKLARDEVVASMTVRLTRGIEIARIAATAGFDTLYVDVEHSSFSLETTGQICLAALEAGIAPFARVPANTPEYISRVLDGGALGVIAPHIGSAEEARAVVSAAKYPPLGERSNAGALPHLEYRSFPAAEANAALNEATMVVVQFESAAALPKADEIIAVEGVDMVLIGLNDLLADWGIPGAYDDPRVREAYAKVIAACRSQGKHCGVGGLATRPDLAAEFVRMGARYVSTGTDLAFLLGACTARAKQVRDIKL
jgi:4-hydroxy-2-oxoheptanedioate aldolase